ncbi:MAG: hypothetical protein M3327_09225 [Actinomycetota bacterium]|nr:hypothetical protein [Actinomycetota bacterium]
MGTKRPARGHARRVMPEGAGLGRVSCEVSSAGRGREDKRELLAVGPDPEAELGAPCGKAGEARRVPAGGVERERDALLLEAGRERRRRGTCRDERDDEARAYDRPRA